MIDYPENLPQPSTNFSGDVASPTIRTELDNGFIEQASRYSSALESFSASWEVSADELLIFEEWFNETLAGGVLVFGLELPKDGTTEIQPVRFVGGSYQTRHKSALWFTVSARLERMLVTNAPANRTLPIPQFLRLGVDEALSQNLTLAHRNALLTVRPGVGSQTTFRIYPPTDPTQYIPFGINNQGLGDTLITSEDVDPIPGVPIPAFPSTLPNINQSFGQDANRKATRIDMDSGHPRQYAGLETTKKYYEVEWDFTLEELQTFQDFFFVTLTNGELTFTLTLPVDGEFIPVPVRFVGGRYSEAYQPVDVYKVSATLERRVDQTVIAKEERPFPLYYAPTVNVTANRKVTAGDANKFFVVTPALGQTISLHIYANLIEFGLLIKGLGNVLITRGPFIVDVGEIADNGSGEVGKPETSIIETLHNLGSIGVDTGAGSIDKPQPSIQSVVEPLGNIGSDTGSGSINKPEPALKVVLEDIGNIGSDTGSGSINKPSPTIDIP